jgi:hypothetical protein
MSPSLPGLRLCPLPQPEAKVKEVKTIAERMRTVMMAIFSIPFFLSKWVQNPLYQQWLCHFTIIALNLMK